MEPLEWPRPAGRLKRCFAIFSLDKINVGPRESDPQNGARRTTFPATIRQTYKSDGGPNYPWSGMQRHDHRKDAGPRHRKAPGRHEFRGPGRGPHGHELRSEEHTSELQSHHDLVCRL